MRNRFFIITADHIFDPSLDMRSRASTLKQEDISTYPIRFRFYDDDNILYYEGRAVSDDAVEEAYYFFQADSGCTYSEICTDGINFFPFIG